jgi:hypothetical protein
MKNKSTLSRHFTLIDIKRKRIFLNTIKMNKTKIIFLYHRVKRRFSSILMRTFFLFNDHRCSRHKNNQDFASNFFFLKGKYFVQNRVIDNLFLSTGYFFYSRERKKKHVNVNFCMSNSMLHRHSKFSSLHIDNK